jgi:putative MATE family efflux protein
MAEHVNDYLGRERIGKLLLKISIPCILSMLVSSLYNIVDQIFIGHGVGFLGNGATNVVYPITVVSLAVALMIGDGTAAYLSICQGRQDTENAHRSVGNAVTLMIASGVVLAAAFLLLRDPILHLFGATPNNIDYARQYYDIIAAGIPFFVFGVSMGSIIRADGSPKYSMAITVVGCIVNVILDPIAIFVLHWGMRGAALATVIGQIVTAVMALGYMFRMKSVKLRANSFALKKSVLGGVLPLGLSSFLTQLSIEVIMVVINNILITFGASSKYGADIPLTAVGIVSKANSLAIAFVVGIGAGSQPVVGYNYGAGQYDRVKKIYYTMIKAECVVGLVGTILFEVFPLQVSGLFGTQDALYNEFIVQCFRIHMATLILCCCIKASSIFLQAIGRPVMSTVLSTTRDFILSIPLQLILPRFLGVIGTIWAIPIIDTVGIIMTFFMIRKVFRDFDRDQAKRLANS